MSFAHRCGRSVEASTSQVGRRRAACRAAEPENKKTGHRGRPQFTWPAAVSHHPAGKAQSAPTWRTMALVVAPQEHPFEIGLGSKREAGLGAQRTWRHATPVTEALHVPLHRGIEPDCSHAAASAHSRSAVKRPSRRQCLAGSSGSGWDREWSAGDEIRELMVAAPSMSASLSVILRCVRSRIPSFGRRRLVGRVSIVSYALGAEACLQLVCQPASRARLALPVKVG